MTSRSSLNPTKIKLLEAAKSVVLRDGFSGLSTRAIATQADTQMSQIRYHFGSKEGMVLALYQYLNQQLADRQTDLFTDSSIPLSKKWDVACDYLDDDVESGFVRVLQELIAVGWSNPAVGDAVRESLSRWRALHEALAKEFGEKYGGLGPFDAKDIAVLVGSSFIGGEAFILLGDDTEHFPVRRALRRFGKVIRHFERTYDREE